MKNFVDKDRLCDTLSSQKNITGLYNTSANECASKALKSELLNILSEEHQIQHEVFTEMQNRGWYMVQAAKQEEIIQAKQKFESSNPAKK